MTTTTIALGDRVSYVSPQDVRIYGLVAGVQPHDTILIHCESTTIAHVALASAFRKEGPRR